MRELKRESQVVIFFFSMRFASMEWLSNWNGKKYYSNISALLLQCQRQRNSFDFWPRKQASNVEGWGMLMVGRECSARKVLAKNRRSAKLSTFWAQKWRTAKIQYARVVFFSVYARVAVELTIHLYFSHWSWYVALRQSHTASDSRSPGSSTRARRLPRRGCPAEDKEHREKTSPTSRCLRTASTHFLTSAEHETRTYFDLHFTSKNGPYNISISSGRTPSRHSDRGHWRWDHVYFELVYTLSMSCPLLVDLLRLSFLNEFHFINRFFITLSID